MYIWAPLEAYAGPISFLKNALFGKQTVEGVSERSITSQNVALLVAALNSDPNPSKGGGEITIVGDALYPDAGPLGTTADLEEASSSSDQISVYVVRDGDSLSQIAKMFGVSINTIIWANDIQRGDLIRGGQTLIILPISGVRHVVQKGDTVVSIAKKYQGDIKEIQDYNGIVGSAELAVGEIVVIPDGTIAGRLYTPSSGAYTSARGTQGPSYDGYYIRPVAGRRTQGLHGYNGVDLAASYGTPVVAAAGGNVIISREYGWNGGYGQYVVVSHLNGTQTLYAHLGANIVSAGDTVVQGQVIGYSGSTGRSTGPHLHFEVRGAQQPF